VCFTQKNEHFFELDIPASDFTSPCIFWSYYRHSNSAAEKWNLLSKLYFFYSNKNRKFFPTSQSSSSFAWPCNNNPFRHFFRLKIEILKTLYVRLKNSISILKTKRISKGFSILFGKNLIACRRSQASTLNIDM